eukprot:5935469-Pyramimonas_sp.AAC.1
MVKLRDVEGIDVEYKPRSRRPKRPSTSIQQSSDSRRLSTPVSLHLVPPLHLTQHPQNPRP